MAKKKKTVPSVVIKVFIGVVLAWLVGSNGVKLIEMYLPNWHPAVWLSIGIIASLALAFSKEVVYFVKTNIKW